MALPQILLCLNMDKSNLGDLGLAPPFGVVLPMRDHTCCISMPGVIALHAAIHITLHDVAPLLPFALLVLVGAPPNTCVS